MCFLLPECKPAGLMSLSEPPEFVTRRDNFTMTAYAAAQYQLDVIAALQYKGERLPVMEICRV
jgi:hypothetical protein